MANNEDLKNMIYDFRVSELRDLLVFTGGNNNGLKTELQDRALDVLKLRSAPVEMKIVELYRRRHEKSGSHKPKVPLSSLSAPTVNVSSIPGIEGNLVDSGGNRNPLSYSDIAATQLTSHGGLIAANVICSDICLKSELSYKILSVLLQPTSLSPTRPSAYVENHFSFRLTPQQVHQITSLRDSVQIHLRFCKEEKGGEQDDNIPSVDIWIKINGKVCELPDHKPTSLPGEECKRNNCPINITKLCHLSASAINSIVICICSDTYKREYVVTVHLVCKIDSTLLSELHPSSFKNPDHTRAMIKEKMRQNSDSEITTTSFRVSLMCPIGKMRIQIPCRPLSCTHIQCFDAIIFLKMNEKKPKWICPICDKPSTFMHLTIDGYFTEIISKVSAQCTEVQFYADGSWTPVMKENKICDVEPGFPMIPKKQEIEVIDLTLDSNSKNTQNLEPISLVLDKFCAFTISNSGENFDLLHKSQATTSCDAENSPQNMTSDIITLD